MEEKKVRKESQLREVAIVGHYGFNKNLLNGQTIKTKNISTQLEKAFGKTEVIKIDTHGGKAISVLKAPFQCYKALKKAKNVIILPAHNGLRVFAPILVFFKNFFKKRNLHYVVIGGWLPEYVRKHRFLAKQLKKFDYIYVETNSMMKSLNKHGFTNIMVMPNFKEIKPLKESELVYQHSEPFRLCTFSRVMREKGIEDAISAVKTINETKNKIVYYLDIYGQIDSNQREWFEELKKSFPQYISYNGSVPSNESINVVKGYFALLFPTLFFTEGVPGTILDAFAAGVPVIASEWESFEDIINENNGVGYEFGNVEDLVSVLSYFANNPLKLNELKTKCLNEYNKYNADRIIRTLKLNWRALQ
ncbi:MAG: glycosyltransferase [Treponema sp.]|nr:glycosyltransferase [Treponema sp.]